MQRRANRSLGWVRTLLLLAGAGLCLGSGVAGSEPEPEAGDISGAGPAVPLDKLLRLPAGTRVEANVERHGGQTRSEWEARFREAREQHLDAETALARTRDAIGEKAASEGGQWRMTAPGLGAAVDSEGGQTPLDYKLTQELRRNREELARTERRLQDLRVEANLASVPSEWRAEPEAEGAPEPAPDAP